MAQRPYLLVSCAMSVDGYIDDASDARLILSGEADADRVDELRAGCDAIMVGAETIRRDDPRLLIRSAARRAARLAAGLPENPLKVTVTGTGNLDPEGAFFTAGPAARLVYCASAALARARARLAAVAEVADVGDPPAPAVIAADLAERGVARVLLEGGGRLATAFLTAGLVDELHLVIAPFFMGDQAAPRFSGPGSYPNGPADRMRLAEARQLGDVVLLRYLPTTNPLPGSVLPGGDTAAASAGPLPRGVGVGVADREPGSSPPRGVGAADRRWLREAIALSSRCPPSQTAFSVGAVIVSADGTPIATGYSRETGPLDHAEEAALGKLSPGDPRLVSATLYTSLEPCGARASKPRTCAELIIAAGLHRVVYAWHEPPLLAAGRGAELLRSAGVTVIEAADLADEARLTNAHLIRH